MAQRYRKYFTAVKQQRAVAGLLRFTYSMTTIRAAFVVLFFFCISQSLVFSQAVDWPTLGFTLAVTNTFTKPTCITHAGDGSGRIFVLSQLGQIQIIQNGNVLAQPFLNISSKVVAAGAEQGLLGLVFPPGFSTNNHFYVDYTRQPDGAIVISRYFLTPTNSNVADSNSEQIVLVILKPGTRLGSNNIDYSNHNAGQLAFGPDGYLYIGVGDGGSEDDPGNFGQQTNTFFGKILRIDVESGASPYAVPASNPFVSADDYEPEIWALGLRNPWRFSFDDLTGDLYIADVGENKFEEIDFQPAGSAGGQNYGWRIMEGDSNFDIPPGFTNFASLTMPVATYSHVSSSFGGAVIGGYVYRGPSQPRMNGMYFYGDFITGYVRGLIRSGTNWQSQVLISTNFNYSTFGEDDTGNLYASDYYNGNIYQIQDTRQAWAPTFSPAGGVINSNSVIVSCLTTNVEIYYSTNGSAPTPSDPTVESGQVIQVTSGITNEIVAFRSDLTPSATVTAVYTLQVGTPIFSQPGGPIASNSVLTISTVTPGAAIYFTIDGTIPTTNSLLYTGPLTLSGSNIVEAIGVADGYNNSSVASASYSAAQLETPIFSPASGPITNGTLISMSVTNPGAVIYYTLDGSTPTTGSAIYSGPVAINGGTIVQAFAALPNLVNSSVQSNLYQLVQTATPVFSPSSGSITNGTPITITCTTAGSAIYYTLDGSTPTTSSTIYSGPVVINGGTTLRAIAAFGGYLNSGVQTELYALAATATPVFTPSSGPITNGTPITITCATPGSTIYYTLDGSTPTTNSLAYLTPVIINGGTTLSAIATSCPYPNSGVESVLYQTAQTATPVFNPPSGPVTNGTLIAITCATPGSTIYFTLDSGTPTTNSTIYSGPVTINGGTTLSALATSVLYPNSGVESVLYPLLQAATPIFNPSGPVTNGTSITVSCATPGSIIYYTLDSSTPTTNSMIYSGPIVVTNPFTLTAIATDRGLAQSSANSVFYGLLDFERTVVTTLAGNPTAGFTNGIGALASFSDPSGICLDAAGNLYVTDRGNNVVREISPAGNVTTCASTVGQLSHPVGICADLAGNIYVADTLNNRICKISTSGSLTTYVNPLDPTVLCSDPAGDLYASSNPYLAEIFPNRDVVPPGGQYRNFGLVLGLAANAANLYATLENEIVVLSSNSAALFAGTGNYGRFSDGSRLVASFDGPRGLAIDASTNVYIAEIGRVRRIGYDGWVSTMAGTGTNGYQDGPGSIAEFNGIYTEGMCVDTNGNIFVADSGNNCIREISPDTAGIGIPDWWQLKYFGYVGINPNEDPDNTGMTAYEDFWAGLNPTNPASEFKIVGTSMTNDAVQITWTSVPGKTYTVQSSTDLIIWNSPGNPVVASGPIASLTDSSPGAQSATRFYRVVVSF